jgi:hypothetical protein
MKRFPKFASMFLALAVAGLVAADSASAAGLRGRNNCDSCAEPACAAAEPACAAAEPACAAAEPACAAAPACNTAEPRRRARRGLFTRRAKVASSKGCTEPGCAATAGCAEPSCAAAEPACGAAEPACGACAGG